MNNARNASKKEKYCKKNTWHVESRHILQPPKYLIIVVDQLRYIDNNVAKDYDCWSV